MKERNRGAEDPFFPTLENRYESYRYKLAVRSDVMVIYRTILREDSSSIGEYRYGIHLHPLFLSVARFSSSRSFFSFFTIAIRRSSFYHFGTRGTLKREGVNDPDGDFQGSADWNHRRDSSRLNSNCWGDIKKVKRVKERRNGTSRGNPNVCYSLSIRILERMDPEAYYLYIGNVKAL